MGRFDKVFAGLVVAVILIVIIAVVVLVTHLDAVVEGVIETAGSQATGTSVTVDTVEISLQDGSAAIHGLSIANPAGYSSADALEIGLVAISLGLDETDSELVVLESILIDGARLTYEQKGSSSNLETILDTLDSSTSVQTSSESDNNASHPKVIIDDFRFLNAEASFSIPGLDLEKTVKIPDIEISGIGRTSAGVAATDAARQILEPVIREAMQAAIDGSVDDLLDDLEDDLKEKAMENLNDKDAQKLRGLLNRD